MEEILYISHCDEEYCSMGSAEFNCPSCTEYNVNYGNLWHEAYMDGVIDTCNHCKVELITEIIKNVMYIRVNE